MSFLLGSMFGACVGVFVAGLLAMGNDDDVRGAGPKADKYYPRTPHIEKAPPQAPFVIKVVGGTDKTAA